MSPTTRRALPWLTAVAAALIISGTFWQGLQRGMDHAIGIGPEPEQTAISIALSETVCGLDLGYVGIRPFTRRSVRCGTGELPRPTKRPWSGTAPTGRS